MFVIIIVDIKIYFEEKCSEVYLFDAHILLKLKIVKTTVKKEGEKHVTIWENEKTNWKYESRKRIDLIDERKKLTTGKCSIAMIIFDESLSYLTSISFVSTFAKKKNISG
jgi:hypothetical protein